MLIPEATEVERILRAATPSERRLFVSSSRKANRGEHVRPRLPERRKVKAILPAWISVLGDLLGTLQRSRTRHQHHLTIAENLAQPVVDQAWRNVSKMLTASNGLHFAPAAKESLRNSLRRRLAFTAMQAAECMWSVLRANSIMSTGSTTHRCEQTLSDILLPDAVEPRTLQLLEHYPALARLWAIQAANWTRNMRDFSVHAQGFAHHHLRLTRTRVIITGISADWSEPHSGNRSVMQVSFKRGGHWFYKPRSGTTEVGWFSLLRWLNRQNFPKPFALVSVFSKEDHCWMQAVKHRPCVNKNEAADYYFRAGALLCLLHWLRGVDFHARNIIADRTQPIIIDCETLFHPNIVAPHDLPYDVRSILRTGMLPICNRRPPGSDSVSALGRVAFGNHSVLIRRRSVSASDFVDSITEGFKVMHTFLTRRQGSKGMTDILKGLRQNRYRRLYCPTANYCARLERSLSPDALRNGQARRQAIAATNQELTRHTRQEIKDLENADIPIFHGKATVLPSYPVSEMNRDLKTVRSVLAAD